MTETAEELEEKIVRGGVPFAQILRHGEDYLEAGVPRESLTNAILAGWPEGGASPPLYVAAYKHSRNLAPAIDVAWRQWRAAQEPLPGVTYIVVDLRERMRVLDLDLPGSCSLAHCACAIAHSFIGDEIHIMSFTGTDHGDHGADPHSAAANPLEASAGLFMPHVKGASTRHLRLLLTHLQGAEMDRVIFVSRGMEPQLLELLPPPTDRRYMVDLSRSAAAFIPPPAPWRMVSGQDDILRMEGIGP